MKTVVKIIAALAAVAGAVYVAATYGDKIVAWAKKLVGSCECRVNCCCTVEDSAEAADEVSSEEAPVEEAPVEEAPAEEAPVEGEVTASEADFEG